MTLLQALAGHVLEISLALSTVIALLLILRPLLGRRYRARLYWWAWLLVALRLVIPLNISLFQAPVQVPVPDRAVLYQRVDSPSSLPPREMVPPDGTVPAAPESAAGGTEGIAATAAVPDPAQLPQPAAYEPSLTLAQALSLLWLGGALALLLWNLAAYARFRRKVRRWRRAEEDHAVLARFEAVRAELNAPRLTLARCSAISSPLITGFLRPALLLPPADYPPAELDAVFRHELTHARRHDLWYKLLLLLARCLHWFNPLVHLMARRAGRDLEITCDEAVVAGRDAAFQAQYGRAVLSAVEHSARQSAPLTSSFHGGKRIMAERLRAILGKGGKKRGIGLLCAVAVLVTVLAAACSVGGTSSQDSPGAEQGELVGYSGPVRWELGDYAVALDNDGAGILTFYLERGENSETVRIPFQQLPADYGPDLRYPYAGFVEARPFTNVLGHDGFVLTYGLGASSVPVEYYTLDEAGSPRLLLACDGMVYELDFDNNGTAEVLECPYGVDGDARLYRWMEQELDPPSISAADLNHIAAEQLGFIKGGVGLEYLEPEGSYTPGAPLQFRCFARMNDAGTPAGEAVPQDAVVSISYLHGMTYSGPLSAFGHDTAPLWPDAPDGMGRDSGTLWWNDEDGQGYGVDFSLHIPSDVSVHEMGSGCHDYWNAGPLGSLELLDRFSSDGLTYLGDGVYMRGGTGWYEGSLDVELGNEPAYRSWYYPLSDGAHCVRFRWREDDPETAERMRATLVFSGDGPITRTYYAYKKPTAAMFVLTDEYAAIFDFLVEERWQNCSESGTLYLPRITCLGTYQSAGRMVYVCAVSETFYYELTLENRAVIPGVSHACMAFFLGSGGDGAPTVDLFGVSQDGEGWAQSIRDLCGPLTDVADFLLEAGGEPMSLAPVWDEMPSSADLLRQYAALTGAPIDWVNLYGSEQIPLADFRDGW